MFFGAFALRFKDKIKFQKKFDKPIPDMYNCKGVFEEIIMLIDLHELIQSEESHKIIKPELEMKKFTLNDESYPIKEYAIEFRFDDAGKKHVSCRCQGYVVLEIPCDRCLEPVENRISIDYFKDLDLNKTSEERVAELDEEVYLEGTTFDTEVFIYNEILVSLPMKVLCSEDCKGVCNRCGTNLNKGFCKCDKTELDPRMSKILDVFNQFKEV